jgi:hypothetical protein
MGGWTGQVHLKQDVIGFDGDLSRSASVIETMISVSPLIEEGTYRLPPEYALADGLIHNDHRIMPPDEIDPDYLDRDERAPFKEALLALGASPDDVDDLMAPYCSCLDPETEPDFR